MIPKAKYLAILLLCAASAFAQTVFPFQGLGSAQFFDNNGQPLTSGVLYSFQAGTSTQQATYTDSSGLTLNPNPIPFGSGARVQIWLTSGAFYKFVLCLQNDGPTCAPADVLFSVDQVPGNPSGLNNGTTFVGTFISGNSSPATTGILRLATSDQICWRNQAGTANLCIFKDSNDVLGWQGDAVKFPEGACTLSALNFDFLCASSTNHRWMMANNGGSQSQIVAAGVDINTSDQVTQLHFGATATPLSGTPPSTSQFLQWNGTQVVGAVPTFTQAPAVTSYVRQELSADVSVPVNTNTTLTSKVVTMPASGCPCRALVAWSIGLQTGSSGGFSAGINDGTNTFAFAQANATGSVGGNTQIGISASGWSHQTYANNQVITLSLKTESTDTGYTVKKAAAQGIVQNSGMDITIFSSN
ncbi:MAG: hypothetical protein JWO19_4431 [Bryobacterales bacterium]|nr:hypothetical protein [Bryobacterales bacterium]